MQTGTHTARPYAFICVIRRAYETLTIAAPAAAAGGYGPPGGPDWRISARTTDIFRCGLCNKGRIASAIAADIGPEPLAHSRRTAEEYGAALDLRLCGGLRGIAPHEADTVVIAGMGGETIIQILTDSPWPRTSGCTLLLQPQTKVELLRRWISENGYVCRDERLVWDKGSSMWCCK